MRQCSQTWPWRLVRATREIGSMCLSECGSFVRLCAVARGVVAALSMIPVVACAGLFSDDPTESWVEGPVEFPASAIPGDLRDFFVSSASPNRFRIDESSITISPDGVVRYVLVVQTGGGARAVTYEGVHCASWRVRIYANGRDDGTWAAARDAQWRPIRNSAYNRVHYALAEDHFCDGLVPPRSRDEVLRRLRTKGYGNTS